jgi:hypothetical protein
MAIDPESGTFISLDEAKLYVSSFRNEYPDQLKGFFAGSKNIQRILDQERCIGIRMYNGYDLESRTTNLVLVGVNTDERDMTEGLILEKLNPCPAECDVNSPLFS